MLRCDVGRQVCYPHRKFLVAAFPVIEQKTMTGATHRLQGQLVLFDLELGDIILIVLPIARALLKCSTVYVRLL